MAKVITITSVTLADSRIVYVPYDGSFMRCATAEFRDAANNIIYTKDYQQKVTDATMIAKLTEVMVTNTVALIKSAEGV